MEQPLDETGECRQEKGRTFLTVKYYSQYLSKRARSYLKDILAR